MLVNFGCLVINELCSLKRKCDEERRRLHHNRDSL
jgi:hypothetical protein